MIENLHKKFRNLANFSFQRIKHHNSLYDESIFWENDFYFNPSIRYGHLEYFKSINGKIEVLHCTFFPSYFKKLPIYGFDIIALNNTVTGIFCDFTDSPYENEDLSASLKQIKQKYNLNSRDLPPWANFFSKNFVCISPKNLDENQLIEDFTLLFKKYIFLSEISNFDGVYLSPNDIKLSIDKQNNYSINQRKNEKTSKALAAYIGESESKEFMETVLFPTYSSTTLD